MTAKEWFAHFAHFLHVSPYLSSRKQNPKIDGQYIEKCAKCAEGEKTLKNNRL